MATIKEIAAATGVSIGTVDRVLHNRGRVSEDTRQRVLAAMEQMEYQPNQAAQGLAVLKKKLRLLAIVPYPHQHPFFDDVIRGVEQKAAELESYGVETKIAELSIDKSHDNTRRLLRLARQCDGLTLMGAEIKESTSALMDFCEETGKPYVLFNRDLPKRNALSCVAPSLERAGQLAAGLSALIGGRKAGVWIFSEGLSYTDMSAVNRTEAFLKELELRYPDMHLLGMSEITLQEKKDRAEVQRALGGEEKPDVIYIDNPADYSICELIAELDPEHLIPVITNDLIEKQLPLFESGIISATICQEPERQGAQPLELLFRYLAYGEVPPRNCLCELSIRILQNMR